MRDEFFKQPMLHDVNLELGNLIDDLHLGEDDTKIFQEDDDDDSEEEQQVRHQLLTKGSLQDMQSLIKKKMVTKIKT